VICCRYNEVQAENKKKYKEHVRRKCRIENQDIEDDKIDEMLEAGTVDSLFTGKKVRWNGAWPGAHAVSWSLTMSCLPAAGGLPHAISR